MTAIYGLWRFDGADVARDFARMDAALSRYGRDDHQRWRPDSNLALGRHLHRTLPEDGFRDDMSDRRYVVSGDARLTERDELVAMLGLEARAETMSDAAIVAAAIEAWDEQAFDRIYGAFAVAAWDVREKRLLLARDHLGHKPLFFHRSAAFVAFASMPHGLQALPDVPRGPDVDSLKRFLAVENLAPGKTHFEGIERIPPGHYAIVTPEGLRETRYWRPDLTPLRLASNDEYADALAAQLDRAVAAALRGAENRVGAHLSSGFDSTAVATSAAVQLAARGGSVVAYTAAPREGYTKTIPGRIADESFLAASTAAMHPNMEHVVIRSDRTPLDNLRRTSSIYGIPVLNICNNSWFEAINDDAAKRGITVMLEGASGNATISETGKAALPELVRRGRLVAWASLALSLVRKRTLGPGTILWNSFRQFIPNELYRRLIDRKFGPLTAPSRISPLKDEYRLAANLEAAMDSPVPGSRERMLRNGWIRPSDNSLHDRLILLATDDAGVSWKAMLAEWNLDYRDPTADRRLVEFSLRIPTEQLIHGGQPRALLRKVLSTRVPAEVLDNPQRGYQAADWHEGLAQARQEVAAEIDRIELFEPTAELLDVKRLRTLVENWPESGAEEWTDYAALVDYRCCLLRAISAASFMRQASGSNY